MRNKIDKVKKVKTKKKIFFKSFLMTVLSTAFVVLILMFGPISFFRNLWVTSAMSTQHHHYLATMFYSQSVIDKILSENTVESLTDFTDGKLIDILFKDRKPTFKLDTIAQDGYKGYMLSISNPAWVRMGISNQFGEKGQRLAEMSKDYNALAAVNASGFIDINGNGMGEKPVDLIVQNYKIINKCREKVHKLICFDRDNRLILGNFTESDIKKYNIRDGAEFGPFLIVNNEPAIVKGDGGWGLGPRTAIGQKADGTVLFLVIDGRRPGYSNGATMRDIQNIMIKYEAVNASNLDGGSSTSLNYNGKLMTKPSGPSGERFIPNSFMVVSNDDYDKAQLDREKLIR